MIKVMSERITACFIKMSIINEEDKENYIFCFEVMFFDFLSLMTVILLSVLFQRLLETVTYLLAFSLLRFNAGGFHAKTHLRCYLTLCSSYITFAILLLLIPPGLYDSVCIASLCIGIAVIFSLAPIQHVNRKLSPAECILFRRRCRAVVVLLAAFTLFGLLMTTPKLKLIVLSADFGMLAIALSMIAAKIQNKFRGNEHDCG